MTDEQSRRGCLWPMWPHNTRPTHEYCNARRVANSSYCAAHRRLSIRDLNKEPRQRFIPGKIAA